MERIGLGVCFNSSSWVWLLLAKDGALWTYRTASIKKKFYSNVSFTGMDLGL
jgi:hypothetical protein